MVVRLRTAEGIIKKYKTSIENVMGEGLSGGYYTKCGLKWDFKPTPQEECDHLECAISIVKADRRYGPWIFVLLLAISVMLFQSSDKLFAIIFGLLPAFFFLFMGLRARKRFEELAEYRDKGTINGIKACQIYRYPEPYQEFFQELERTIDIVGNWRSKGIAGRFLAAISAIFFIITVVAELKGIIELATYAFMISVVSVFLAILFLRWDVNMKKVWIS